MSENPIHQPHDKLFKKGFTDPSTAASFLSSVLPATISQAIDWSTLTLENGSFTDSQFRHSETDLLFSVTLDGRPARVYLLFEHQREQPKDLALRLLRYMVRIWEGHVPDLERGGKLPVIIPVVLAQNERPWAIAEHFRGLVDIPEGFVPFVPDFTFRLIELAGMPYESMPGTAQSVLILRVLKAEITGETEAEAVWDTDLMLQVRQEIFEAVLRYLADIAVDTPRFLHRLEIIENSQLKQTAMTVAQQLRQEGRQEGLQEGRQEGLQEGRKEGLQEGRKEGRQEGRVHTLQANIIEILEERFSRVPEGLAEEIQAIGDPAKLSTLLRVAVRCASIEDFATQL